MATPKWFKLLSRPVQLLVEERIRADGFGSEPDAWVAGILTTARHSPQGYVLRLSMNKRQAAELSREAVEAADLFAAADGEGGEKA